MTRTSKADPPKIHKLMDGKLHIFRRPATQFWWCGFYHHKRYVRSSTRTADLKSAQEFARQWFYGKQLELAGTLPPAPYAKSFAAAADKALASYRLATARGERSASYLKSFEILIKRIVPVIGQEALESINQSTWSRYRDQRFKKKAYKPATIHQHKNAIHVVLKQAAMRGELASVPQFLDDSNVKVSTPRTWFEREEYQRLIGALWANIELHKKTKWSEAALELYDYCEIVVNSGLRVGEAMNMRFCDVETRKEHDNRTGDLKSFLVIKNIKGKRGTGEAKTFFDAVFPFLRCCERAKIQDRRISEEKVFKEYHRDMFREVLERSGLRITNDRPPRRRDLMSLRHSYICWRLKDAVPVYDIAANCRTSVAMIQEHYAKWMSPAQSTSINRSTTKLSNVEDD
jgi:integrase